MNFSQKIDYWLAFTLYNVLRGEKLLFKSATECFLFVTPFVSRLSRVLFDRWVRLGWMLRVLRIKDHQTCYELLNTFHLIFFMKVYVFVYSLVYFTLGWIKSKFVRLLFHQVVFIYYYEGNWAILQYFNWINTQSVFCESELFLLPEWPNWDLAILVLLQYYYYYVCVKLMVTFTLIFMSQDSAWGKCKWQGKEGNYETCFRYYLWQWGKETERTMRWYYTKMSSKSIALKWQSTCK